jgi:hypothetical protein
VADTFAVPCVSGRWRPSTAGLDEEFHVVLAGQSRSNPPPTWKRRRCTTGRHQAPTRADGSYSVPLRPRVSAGQSRAEADGNRTRLGARAPTTVLKTAGPTRNPDASEREHTREGSSAPRRSGPARSLSGILLPRRRSGRIRWYPAAESLTLRWAAIRKPKVAGPTASTTGDGRPPPCLAGAARPSRSGRSDRCGGSPRP